MMMPTVPKPTTQYIAAQRAECEKASACDDGKAKEEMREQAPFWMSQATLAYRVPDKVFADLQTELQIKEKNYNGVDFLAAPLKFVNMMNRGIPDDGADPMPETFPGKYRAMGSFFADEKTNEPGNVIGRYFLVEVTDPMGLSLIHI